MDKYKLNLKLKYLDSNIIDGNDVENILTAIKFIEYPFQSSKWKYCLSYDSDSQQSITDPFLVALKYASIQMKKDLEERIAPNKSELKKLNDFNKGNSSENENKYVEITRTFSNEELFFIINLGSLYYRNIIYIYQRRARKSYPERKENKSKPLDYFLEEAEKAAEKDGKNFMKTIKMLEEILDSN